MFNPTVQVLVAQQKDRRPDITFEGLLKRFPGLAEAEAVCWTGSTAVGWGNTYSDIDIYAFSDQELDLPADETVETWPGVDQSGVRWHKWIGEYDKSRVDLTVWPTDTLATAIAPYLDAEVELCSLSDVLQDFIYRLSIGVPLKNEGYFQKVWELLDGSSYRRSLARWVKVWVENRLVDVAGQLDAGDDASARVSAGLAAAMAADMCLVWAGELCRGPKWLMRRLERKPECGIGVDEYRKVVLDGARPGESDGEYALRVARWAQGHLIRVEGDLMRVS